MAKEMMSGLLQQNRFIRGAIFLTVTLLPIVVLALVVIMPVLDAFSARDAEIAQQADRLARLKGIAAFDPNELRVNMPSDPVENYLTGPNEGLVSAKLQIRLKNIVQTSGTQLRLIQGMPAKTDGMLRLIGARLNIAGPIKSVHQAISAIEKGTPFLFITSATLKPSRQIHNVANQPKEPILEAQLEVFGVFRSGQAQ
jgi:general secretion pathway protein M